MAFSFLSHYGYVKRKGTRTARKLPDDFEIVKAAFLGRVADLVKTHKISPSMIVNFDQTGAKIIPVVIRSKGVETGRYCCTG